MTLTSEGVKQVLNFETSQKKEDPRKILKDIQKLKEKFAQQHFAGGRQSNKVIKQRETQRTDSKNYGMYDPSQEPKPAFDAKDLSILAIGERKVTEKP